MLKTLTVRSSLMATLALFTIMLMIGAALGIFTLQRANRSFTVAYGTTTDAQGINDVYKDATRTRIALMRVYSDVKEFGKLPAISEHLATAQKYHGRAQQALNILLATPHSAGTDAQLHRDLLAASQDLNASLANAVVALQTNDLTGFTRINYKELTAKGAAVSALLEQFQRQSAGLGQQLANEREQEYRAVVITVALGIAVAILLITLAYWYLQRIVLAPLAQVIHVLDQVAQGDLTQPLPRANPTEIGRLLRAIAKMQGSLIATVTQVRGSAESTGRLASEMADANQDLAMRTESQASSLQQTAASIEELTGSVQQTAEHAHQARELASSATELASASSGVVEDLAHTMEEIRQSSQKIADIISVIDGIAFQTNILALNAAVEAARAGEHGCGFAVVANEVRTLAQRSALASREIAQLISDSATRVTNGSDLAGQASQAMRKVTERVQVVADIVVGIAQSSREQSLGISQVNQAIAQLDDLTQRNAALVEQATNGTQCMRGDTANLVDAVCFFKIQTRTCS